MSLVEHITSRAISLLAATAVAAAVALSFERQEQQAIQSFTTREDLLAYLESSQPESFWIWYAVMLVIGAGYLCLVEALAYALRAGWRVIGPGRGTPPAQSGGLRPPLT